ncbi:MAG: glycosyl transferase [Spirosomataceae bacterium]
MTLAFTICSVNYLAQAKTLGDSLAKHCPEIKYVIGLTDQLADKVIDKSQLPQAELLEVHQLNIPNFKWMCQHYDITELNTAVKPYFIDYLFQRETEVNKLIYFDPDIIVYQPLTELSRWLDHYSIVVTPHICSPVTDGYHPSEETHLNTGIFNLGFIALRRAEDTQRFVNWWKEKLAYECKIDLANGLFVDQNWVNFAPYYFQNTIIIKNLGYNVAYWNLHERLLHHNNSQWTVQSLLSQENTPLIFFHYSGYQLAKPTVLSKYQNRFTFEQRPDVVPLFEDYAHQLHNNGNAYFAQFACSYIRPKKVIRYRRVRKVLNYPFELLLKWIA